MAEEGNLVGREFVDFQDQLVEFTFEAKGVGAVGAECGRLAFKRPSEMLERRAMETQQPTNLYRLDTSSTLSSIAPFVASFAIF